MSYQRPPADQLRIFHASLTRLAPQWGAWSNFDSWIAGFRPFLRYHFCDYLEDFEKVAKTPIWVIPPVTYRAVVPLHRQPRENQEAIEANNRLVGAAQLSLLAFLKTLIDIASQPAETQLPTPKADVITQPLPCDKGGPIPDPKRVFVIYGRNTTAYDQMVKFLRALKLDPKSFYDVSAECGANPTVLQIVRHGMEQAAGVVGMFTPDEWSVLRPEHDPMRGATDESRRWQARANVIFEAGLALGLAANRTVLVRLGHDVKLFSDVGGIHLVNLNNSPEMRNYLRGKLKAAGCQPDMETGDHLHIGQAGDFEKCVFFTGTQQPRDPFAPVQEGADNAEDAPGSSMEPTSQPWSTLSPEAKEILLGAVTSPDGHDRGSILVTRHSLGLTVQAGRTSQTIGHDDHRRQAKYERGVDQLIGAKLLVRRSAGAMDVTEEGYLVGRVINHATNFESSG